MAAPSQSARPPEPERARPRTAYRGGNESDRPAPEEPDPASSADAELRLAPARTGLLAVGVLIVCMTPLAAQRVYLLPLYLIPLLLVVWILRTGTRVDRDGVLIRAVLGSRRYGWDHIRGLSAADNGTLCLVLENGSTLRMPCARIRHLDLIARVSGGRVPRVG